MAPTRPPRSPSTRPSSSHRTLQPAKSILKNPAPGYTKSYTSTSSDSLFPTSKKDKRRIKHATLINKVTKPSASSAAAKNLKRRKATKSKRSLATSLSSLADALPDDSSEYYDNERSKDHSDRRAGSSKTNASESQSRKVDLILRKSIKSKSGALKRREKIDRGERDRFLRNLAQLSIPSDMQPEAKPAPAGQEDRGKSASQIGGQIDEDRNAATATTQARWGALRNFISQTLETKPESTVTPQNKGT